MTGATLTINTLNIIKNYKAIKKYVGEQVNVAAVIKCNCYGLGMKYVAPAIFKAGCKEFYVANMNEGIALRNLLNEPDIYVLNGIEAGQEKGFLKERLIPVINNLHQLEVWAHASKKYRKKLKCSLHVDSGMTRTGIDCHLADEALSSLSKNKSLELCYVLSHLACADDVGNTKNKCQLDFMNSLKKKYPKFKYSFSNSAGIFLGKEYHFDQVRPGIILYGENPCSVTLKSLPITLSSVINLTSKIIDIHFIKDEIIQRSVGYNAIHKLKPGMVTATIPVGYGDGYSRRLSNKGCCYIDDIKVNIIGNISMDLTCIDISNIPKCFQKIGQEVELIGNNISIEKIARLSDTINYEILTSFSDRYMVKYITNLETLNVMKHCQKIEQKVSLIYEK
jgi:alanine racemase